jgi:hypothetical protein
MARSFFLIYADDLATIKNVLYIAQDRAVGDAELSICEDLSDLIEYWEENSK